MKENKILLPKFRLLITAASFFPLAICFAQEAGPVLEVKTSPQGESVEAVAAPASAPAPRGNIALVSTDMDHPGETHEIFGMMPGSALEKSLKRLSKIDLDGDMNYDGVLDNDDSSDQGASEDTSPGLQIGVGELSKLVIRFKAYDANFPGELFVTIEVDGIDRFAPSGKYEPDSPDKELLGHIRVWRDLARTELLVDSADPEKRRFEWMVDKEKMGGGISGGIPRVVYVEAVKASDLFEGDLRFLISASHNLSADSKVRSPSGVYSTAFDHILFTVRPDPLEKEFVNNNAEGVWSTVAPPKPAPSPKLSQTKSADVEE